MNYLALGDSISIDDYTGVDEGGAISQLARLIRAAQIENLAWDGQTTDSVLAALERVTVRPDVVTLTAGGNDFLHAAFRHTLPPNAAPDAWRTMMDAPLANLRQIAARLAMFQCPVIMNTVYDPTDGDNALGAQIGISVEARQAFDTLNEGIKIIAREHGFLLADLQTLFRGHGINTRHSWVIMNIEPNYEGATAIALCRHRLFRSAAA